MSNVIDISYRYKDFIYKDDFCIICSKELQGEKKQGEIPTGRTEHEYILIASCNECYYKSVKKHMNDTDYWGIIYNDRGIFEDLPPIESY